MISYSAILVIMLTLHARRGYLGYLAGGSKTGQMQILYLVTSTSIRIYVVTHQQPDIHFSLSSTHI